MGGGLGLPRAIADASGVEAAGAAALAEAARPEEASSAAAAVVTSELLGVLLQSVVVPVPELAVRRTRKFLAQAFQSKVVVVVVVKVIAAAAAGAAADAHQLTEPLLLPGLLLGGLLLLRQPLGADLRRPLLLGVAPGGHPVLCVAPGGLLLLRLLLGEDLRRPLLLQDWNLPAAEGAARVPLHPGRDAAQVEDAGAAVVGAGQGDPLAAHGLVADGALHVVRQVLLPCRRQPLGPDLGAGREAPGPRRLRATLSRRGARGLRPPGLGDLRRARPAQRPGPQLARRAPRHLVVAGEAHLRPPAHQRHNLRRVVLAVGVAGVEPHADLQGIHGAPARWGGGAASTGTEVNPSPEVLVQPWAKMA
mmetsp:Transcript_10414/g.30962  ORF Transcript_10414/g.30962 Transcript_10414/m.30962 type:complete len:363 (+) Transcript_10414:255-1343(+)